MSFSGWLEIINIALFPDEVIVPCNCVKAHIYTLTHTLLTFSPMSVWISPAALTSTWTMTATTRTTMTGTVRKLLMLAHTPYCLSVWHGETKRGFFILAVPGSLCSLSLSANNCLSSFHSAARSSHASSPKDIDTVFFHIDLHTYSTDTQTAKPIKIFSISSVLF